MRINNAADVPAETVEAGAEGVCIQWLLDESHGAPHFSLRRFTIAPGGFTPLHAHDWEHVVYILDGQGAVVEGEREHPFRPDDAILVPPGCTHQFRNTGAANLRLLCLVPNGPATQH